MNKELLLKVLNAAKPHLEQEAFVCCAATAARRAGEIMHSEEDAFVAFIMGRLEGSYTVTSWLERQGFETKSVSWEDKLAYRHRWIDSMIEEAKRPY